MMIMSYDGDNDNKNNDYSNRLDDDDDKLHYPFSGDIIMCCATQRFGRFQSIFLFGSNECPVNNC